MLPPSLSALIPQSRTSWMSSAALSAIAARARRLRSPRRITARSPGSSPFFRPSTLSLRAGNATAGRCRGLPLLSRYGCVNCHTVKLPDGSTVKASDDPPSLSHVADKTTREWIYAWMKDPQAYSVSATMPNFKLSDDDARDMSAFLIANSTAVLGDSATLSAKVSSDR